MSASNDNQFFNPFHFVPVAKPSLDLMPRDALKQTPPERSSAQHVTHDRYVAATYSGRIVCRLKLESPTVLGAVRTAGTEQQPAEVELYQVLAKRGGKLACEPAIPETSLRGMIGAIFETATNSAMRVLSDTELSIRMGMSDALQTVGVVRVDDRGKRWLLPLAFPMLKEPANKVPSELAAFASHMQVKFYLNGFSDDVSSTADTEAIYFVKASYSTLAGDSVHASDPASRGGWMLGRRHHAVTSSLITRDQWLEMSAAERDGYKPGLLRNLGRHSIEALQNLRDRDANGERSSGTVLPSGVKHRWFIPLKPEIYDPVKNEWKDGPGQWLEIEDAAARFEAMAKAITLQDVRLPFEVRGSLRNGDLKKRAVAGETKRLGEEKHCIEIRWGDLLCFGKDGREVSISCIWRKPKDNVWNWFEAIDNNLVPMNPRREQITLAEQLFGFVEQAEKGKDRGNRVKALAGRVRFSAGRICSAMPDGGFLDPPQIAQILGAPKPPSPLLYFRSKNGKPLKKSQMPATAAGDAAPLGRKWYLYHDPDLLDWTTVDQSGHLKQKARLQPLKSGTEFVFDVRFDNLSRRELALLVYCLRPTDSFRHRLGMGKPLGLGAVQVEPLGLLLVDRAARYAADDLFAAPRYADVAWLASGGPPDLQFAADDVRRQYAVERAAAAGSNGPSWDDLRAEARQLLVQHAPDALAVLECLGDPALTRGTPVHYPRLPDALLPDVAAPDGTTHKKNTETKLYQWHTWNEPRPIPQSHQPLTAAKPQPSPLSKEPPFRFFLYAPLPDNQRIELVQWLAAHYPGRYHPTAGPLAAEPVAYDQQIRLAIAAGEILVHLGVDQAADVPREMITTGFGPLALRDREGNPERDTVAERFRRTYLAPLRTG